MIVICKHTNQLCNRIFTYLPIISYALEANEKVCFWFQYDKYAAMFPNLEKHGIKSYCEDSKVNSKAIYKVVYGIVRFFNLFVHLVIKPGEKIPLRKPWGVLFGPRWREVRYDNAYVAKHRETLTDMFAPTVEVESELDGMFGKEDGVVTVGVHIRRGDYRTYRNGQYYYENDVYLRCMNDVKRALEAEGKRVRFFLSSNERFTKEEFPGCEIFSQDGTSVAVDLYGLSRCDYIMGPPSTFSMWASFYGKKPVRYMMDKNVDMSLDQFSVVDAFVKFN
ncbi:MAG: alpha-1,2-fucosyltransferase [Bacteroidales bacterium]|nr:alpha-1,2-fucosyltransferase [Bacteroidales bacterium]